MKKKQSTSEMERLQDVHYNLKIDDCTDEVGGHITKTVARLPIDIAEKVFYEVTFFDAGAETFGSYLSFHFSPLHDKAVFHLIYLNLSAIQSEQEKHYVIAHEIAHFILGHRRDGDYEKQERDADALAAKWGFTVPERRQEVYDEIRGPVT